MDDIPRLASADGTSQTREERVQETKLAVILTLTNSPDSARASDARPNPQ